MTSAHVAAQAALGITPTASRNCVDAPDIATARASFAVWKAEVKARYRERVRELHPDLVGDCPVKAEQLRATIEVWEAFEKLRVLPRPRPRPQPFVRIVINGFGSQITWANNSTTTNGW